MTEISNDQFSELTLKWLSQSSLRGRQELGQFMTPRYLRTQLLNGLEIKSGDRVLDPAAGTGEFLRQAIDTVPGINVVGWDIDSEILKFASNLVPEAKLEKRSALEAYDGDKFDFVIGNPPYFQLRLESKVRAQYSKVISGRPNIYALFFQAGIDNLKDGGILSYVVPPSMNSGAYFKNLRKYLTSENHIVSLKLFSQADFFADAQTAVQVITVRKGKGESSNVFHVKGPKNTLDSIIFCEDPIQFSKLYRTGKSLYDLGYQAVTGATVWNQNKERLTNTSDDATVPLLYARNISTGEIQLSPDHRRPQYIRGSKHFFGEAILVNRIIGGVGKGQIRAALVPKNFKFAAENHLNVITPRPDVKQLVSFKELLNLVTSQKTVDCARALTGNTQLSASEWNYLVPLG